MDSPWQSSNDTRRRMENGTAKCQPLFPFNYHLFSFRTFSSFNLDAEKNCECANGLWRSEPANNNHFESLVSLNTNDDGVFSNRICVRPKVWPTFVGTFFSNLNLYLSAVCTSRSHFFFTVFHFIPFCIQCAASSANDLSSRIMYFYLLLAPHSCGYFQRP